MDLSNYVTTEQAIPLWEQWSGKEAATNMRQLFSYHSNKGNFARWAKRLKPPLGADEPAALKYPDERTGRWYIHKRLIEFFALNPPRPGSSPNSTALKNQNLIFGWIRDENLQSRREMAKRLDRTPESVSRYLLALLKAGKIAKDEKGYLSIVTDE
jgi:hypothetical protein